MFTDLPGLIAKLKDLQTLLEAKQVFEGSIEFHFCIEDVYQLSYTYRTINNSLYASKSPDLSDLQHWSRLLLAYVEKKALATWLGRIAKIPDEPSGYAQSLLNELGEICNKDELNDFWFSIGTDDEQKP